MKKPLLKALSDLLQLTEEKAERIQKEKKPQACEIMTQRKVLRLSKGPEYHRVQKSQTHSRSLIPENYITEYESQRRTQSRCRRSGDRHYIGCMTGKHRNERPSMMKMDTRCHWLEWCWNRWSCVTDAWEPVETERVYSACHRPSITDH